VDICSLFSFLKTSSAFLFSEKRPNTAEPVPLIKDNSAPLLRKRLLMALSCG